MTTHEVGWILPGTSFRVSALSRIRRPPLIKAKNVLDQGDAAGLCHQCAGSRQAVRYSVTAPDPRRMPTNQAVRQKSYATATVGRQWIHCTGSG